LMTVTFSMAFTGWSVYPLIALSLLGGLLIFLAINKSARERMEDIMRGQDFRPTEAMEIQKISTHVSLVSRGFGVGFIQPSYVRENGLENMVTLYDVTMEKSLCEFGAICLKGRQLPDYVKTVIKIAGEIMKESEEEK